MVGLMEFKVSALELGEALEAHFDSGFARCRLEAVKGLSRLGKAFAVIEFWEFATSKKVFLCFFGPSTPALNA
ncbi:hypothetical protein GJ744_008722 [Endocarpon pusillum]|uniref:Uncharacterized protein n=1 Tax=Endocarpon pusillum TaxID=364733 RepID=A0A8H7AGR6_9EURO|nr:hypothetical protein GJ744_008722 [Endocarpon pusillum]